MPAWRWPIRSSSGTSTDIDLTQLFDDSKSIAEGAFTIPGWRSDSWWTVRIYAESGFLPLAR
ncbi:MAG: hypothetical protein ACRDGH_17225, partial [Candidatus Limnocylindria bacterium]